MFRRLVPWLLRSFFLGFAFASPSAAEESLPLPLPLRQPLTVDSFLLARRATAPTPALDLRVIAEIDRTISDAVALGDTDHDGRREAIILGSSPCGYRIFEEQGGNAYSLEYIGTCLEPYATADLDGDGRAELVAQSGGYVQVYEAQDASSYPTNLVWSSPYLSNVVGETTIGDSDGDGRMEILHSQNSFSGRTSVFLIYENRGDNAFSLVLSDTIATQGLCGRKVIADFDRDGRKEIAFSGDEGRLFVYEAIADDVWQRTWSRWTGLLEAYAVCAGRDSDGNGRAEVFVMGDSSHAWTSRVYEAEGDNSFARVWSVSIYDGFVGVPHNATANLDDLGKEEYIVDTGVGLWVYRSLMPGQWTLAAQVPESSSTQSHTGIYAFDLNQNGRPELIWPGSPTTLILEYRSGVSATRELVDQPEFRPLAAFPNPCRLEARLRTSASLEGAENLAVYDVAGRVVERRALIKDAHGATLWPAQHLPSGVYWLRLESRTGQTLAAGRATVMR